MPNQLPLTLDFGALPQTGQGYDPQSFADRLGINAKIFTEQDFALFVTGSTAPTSDVGPWLANGNEWRVWDANVGAYVPITIDQASLGYFIGSVAPDPAIYQFWIETTAGGSPLALKIYYSGNWTDVYASQFANYSTTAQMNAAIAAAVAGASPQTYPAQATHNAAQTIDVDNAFHLIVLDNAQINPAPAPFITASSRYVAPVNGIYKFSAIVQIDDVNSTPASLQMQVGVFKNGVIELGTLACLATMSGSRWHANFSGMVGLNATDYVDLRILADDGVNTGDVEVGNVDFTVFLVKPT